MSVELDPGATLPDPKTRIPLSFERVLLAMAMASMALITAVNVLARYLTNVSFAITEEYSVVLMVVIALELMIVATIITFKPIDRMAAWLLAPYAVWVGYATALNAAIVGLN